MPAADPHGREAPAADPGRPAAEDLVAELTRCRAELQAAYQQADYFAFGISHDLRAPLRAVESFAGLLDRDGASALDETGRGYLQRIRAATARMAGLLDAMQDLSRAGRQELRPELVDLSLLAEWAGADLIGSDPARAARIEVQPGLATHGDERLLRLMISQLLRNAWYFTAPDQPITIDIDGERDADGLQLRVRDHGIGFDPRYADKLFEPFQRLHGPEEGAGAGLGLAIARRIVERHGGSIRAEVVPGDGSVFHVRLPRSVTDGGTSQATSSGACGARTASPGGPR